MWLDSILYKPNLSRATTISSSSSSFKKLPDDTQLYIWGLAATPTIHQEVYVSFLNIMLD